MENVKSIIQAVTETEIRETACQVQCMSLVTDHNKLVMIAIN